MGIIQTPAQPKGNLGMTLFGTNNDDTTVTLPDMGFDFYYNGSVVRQLRTSGNTWVGFGSATEHLKVNRRDASYNKLYYALETEGGKKTFRVRFEGNSVWSSWNTNELIWELTLFETGVIRLVIEKIPNTGTNSFDNPNVGTQTLTLSNGASLIFFPGTADGKNYTIYYDSNYIPTNEKYLIVDDDGVKTFSSGSWSKIGDLPLTEEMFLSSGLSTIPQSYTGILGNPKLYFYTDDDDKKSNPTKYILETKEVVNSKPKVIKQKSDFLIPSGKNISSITVDTSFVRRDSIGNPISTNGAIKLAISLDSGASYYTYNQTSGAFEAIDINDINMFLNQGIDVNNISQLNIDLLNPLLTGSRTIRFAYIFYKPTLDDVCKLKKIKIIFA
ncbi:hypothetical protein [Caloramator proteoclasticus]|uniref:Uncharacterized protein n=1 Tax=Caloramator proteoclasticus DSM 10124 TaxID=1121262 RepID=A0A1M5ATE7_9CLOT|nr:hypothetical protein [Caloramator proteoclasticus]SHF33475.1 hypothetical protein SAMN02746091_02285 [Caloramator proteoclasticus DSM 10124]